MNIKYKIMVAHSAQQHSFKTAIAIKKTGSLFKYATTVYMKKNSFTTLGTKFLKGDNFKRAIGRKTELLEDSEVIQFCEIEGLFLLLLQRIDKSKFFYSKLKRFIDKKFGKNVASYAIKNKVDILIMYDTLSCTTFEILKKRAPNIIKIIDMSAPSFSFMNEIFKNELTTIPGYSLEQQKKEKSKVFRRALNESMKEIRLADYFLVASEFTKKSLIHYDVSEQKIFKCPYGIDFNYFVPDKEKKSVDEKLKCVFIGRVTAQKGAYHLLDAIRNIDDSLISMTFLGNYDPNSQYYKDFKSKVIFLGHVTRDRVKEECQKADLLIFPSIADGYGLSVVEGMACGLPVICSVNAGVSDIIIDNYNGFKISAGNVEVLKEKIEWCIKHKKDLRMMGENARKTSLECSWENYYQRINHIVEEINGTK